MAYQAGSLCADCCNFGLKNYLKPFYINLEEQIIKCESSQCMFPYLTKSIYTSFPDSKPADIILSIDEFVEESAKKIDTIPAKLETKDISTQDDKDLVMFDFASLLMDNPVEEDHKKQKQITTYLPASKANILETLQKKDSEPNVHIKNDRSGLTPPKARISRCLSNVRSSKCNSKQLNRKIRSQSKQKKTVFVIEPQSGRSMRPLDLIKQYMKF